MTSQHRGLHGVPVASLALFLTLWSNPSLPSWGSLKPTQKVSREAPPNTSPLGLRAPEDRAVSAPDS